MINGRNRRWRSCLSERRKREKDWVNWKRNVKKSSHLKRAERIAFWRSDLTNMCQKDPTYGTYPRHLVLLPAMQINNCFIIQSNRLSHNNFYPIVVQEVIRLPWVQRGNHKWLVFHATCDLRRRHKIERGTLWSLPMTVRQGIRTRW